MTDRAEQAVARRGKRLVRQGKQGAECIREIGHRLHVRMTFIVIAGERLRIEPTPHDPCNFPRQIGGVAETRIEALPDPGRHQVRGVAR